VFSLFDLSKRPWLNVNVHDLDLPIAMRLPLAQCWFPRGFGGRERVWKGKVMMCSDLKARNLLDNPCNITPQASLRSLAYIVLIHHHNEIKAWR
jgi:hypothetical protein